MLRTDRRDLISIAAAVLTAAGVIVLSLGLIVAGLALALSGAGTLLLQQRASRRRYGTR
jgi:hypothetical protein